MEYIVNIVCFVSMFGAVVCVIGAQMNFHDVANGYVSTRATRKRGIRLLVIAALLGCVGWLSSIPNTSRLEAHAVATREHNRLNCKVMVEGRTYQPESIYMFKGAGHMILSGGESVRFLGGVIGSGCK